ncbi:hypothetical protein M419DRAFT_35558 [Trichoderma reesei RUT C-30]|uniref:Uncharacterized protein n=1 Tax=Hypocrea jecorina (strain ATCC 56765 / BCRC 32924 / NRRL 11460 / Rut C-30) TaxID=1344414 RepID=A0A024S8N7_HYPJR|nr:hypothetical protein M419DRAFT_35558 [Trichoderma reesei RUT C-30]
MLSLCSLSLPPPDWPLSSLLFSSASLPRPPLPPVRLSLALRAYRRSRCPTILLTCISLLLPTIFPSARPQARAIRTPFVPPLHRPLAPFRGNCGLEAFYQQGGAGGFFPCVHRQGTATGAAWGAASQARHPIRRRAACLYHYAIQRAHDKHGMSKQADGEYRYGGEESARADDGQAR